MLRLVARNLPITWLIILIVAAMVTISAGLGDPVSLLDAYVVAPTVAAIEDWLSDQFTLW